MKDKFEALVEHLLDTNFFMEEAIELLEKTMIQRALEQAGGNQSAASKRLGIHRNTMQRKVAEYKLATGRVRAQRKPVSREGRSRRKKTGIA
ncbi:MAG TPA: helix-turn-helix domain-containing protein [Bryobacteraceae bacterium]|nr:helix-turn-helix domain-containing protein [Bryobacteraceae bacterium]